jgi:hypothetical protein
MADDKVTIKCVYSNGAKKQHSVRMKLASGEWTRASGGGSIDPLGDIYVKNDALSLLGFPKAVRITIEAVED